MKKEQREEVIIVVVGKGEVILHYRYNFGPVQVAYEINSNEYDLAHLL